MPKMTPRQLIEAGVRVGDLQMAAEDKIWSRYSNDKVDIGERLARVLRALHKAFPLATPLRALSIGSSAEPQFRLLQTAFAGGLYLLDIERAALDVVRERSLRQLTTNVATLHGDYRDTFLREGRCARFLRSRLGGRKVHLVTLHHSLYYAQASQWSPLFDHLARHILAPRGAIHAVLMASRTDEPFSTTWLYNHFAGKFCGCHNDQDLRAFGASLARRPAWRGARIRVESRRVRFHVDDFVKFMAIVWMILLYPNVHRYTRSQREEIAEFVYRRFWKARRPLIQVQDHLVLTRGLGG